MAVDTTANPDGTLEALNDKQGCIELCEDHIQMNPPKTALNFIATWIFPLSILLSLPYESLHGNAVGAWLGSPQTSLAAIIFNIDQVCSCH